MIKKILAITLVLLMLLPTVISCAKNDNDENGSESDSASASVSETDDLYDENGYLKDSLPDLDFGGYEFNILGWDDGYVDDFWVEESSGSAVSASLYARNKTVESRLNIKIDATFIPGNFNNQADFVAYVINTAYASGDNDFDLIGSYSMCGGTLATNGIICDLYDLKYLDFEKPWWSDSLIERSELGGKLYFATGDLANSYIYALHFLTVNLNMLETLKLDDPRQMVKDGTWTLEKMKTMTEGVGAELDKEEGKTAGDAYGYAYYSSVEPDCWIAASGMKMSSENSNGVLSLTDDFLGNKTHTLITNIATQKHSTNDWYNKPDKEVVLGGNTLFGGVAGELMNSFASVPFKYGVLPYPKITEGQEGYYSLLGFTYTTFSIPNNAKDPDMSAAVLECMNSEAYRSSSPALFERVFKSRFTNDPIDVEMYDCIRAGAYVDSTRIFHSVFEASYGWRGTPVGMFRTAIGANSGTWMSDIAGIKQNINTILSNISASTK